MRRTVVLSALASADSEVGQALALLEAAGVPEPSRLPLGRGDRELLDLHREIAATDLALAIVCPDCGTENELVLSGETVPPERPRVAVLGSGGGLRAPTYTDLIDLPTTAEEATLELLRRCTVGTPSRSPDEDALAGVDDSLAGPLVTACAECGAAIESQLDAQRAVLESIERIVDRVDVEVHLLARAYHWDLAEIEQLPDERRERLAALVEAGT
jgi:hypothetical protein